MKKMREFDNILNECLERMLAGEATVDECLARYPEQAVELAPLLRTAADARTAVNLAPRRQFREMARHRFQDALREMEAKKSPARKGYSFGWAPRWALTVIVVVVVLVGGGGGTVAAASGSLPDEPLYPVKMAGETVQLALTFSDLAKARLYTAFTDRRVAEIIKMAEKGKVEQVERLTEHLNSQLVAMAVLAAPEEEAADAALMMKATAGEEIAPDLAAPLPEDTAPARLAVPAPTVPPPEPAADTPATADAPAPETAATAEIAGVPEAAATSMDNGAGARGERDRYAELLDTMAASTAENAAALEAELDKNRDAAVREALRRALAEVMHGYERNYRHWNKDR